MKKLLVVAGIVLLVMAAAAVYAEKRLPSIVKERAARILRERYNGEVEFGRFDVSLFPLSLNGEDLKFRQQGRTDVPPIIAIKKFSAEASILGFLRTPAHVDSVKLDTLQITVPPKNQRLPEQPKQHGKDHYPVVVDQIECANCQLTVLPGKPDKDPLVFAIHQLHMQNAGLARSAPFQATLTNPKPNGEIQTSGHFGPWQRDDVGKTPVSGDYTFDHADMSTFRGLAGILSSTGIYQGVLERILAQGETDTPDFRLSMSGHPVPLHTQFHAIIDGTNGDTLLQPVTAQFLKTSLKATGGVENVPGQKGKTITLDAETNGRLEDILRLVLKSDQPPMSGAIRFHSKIVLPPGEPEVVQRLRLDGRFVTDNTSFTKENLKERLKSLSRRAQGKPSDFTAGSDVFDLNGRFIAANGVAKFPELKFSVDGADVRLHGQFALKGEELDFRGIVRLDATLSQTQTGFKSLALKLVDPFFKKDGAGAVIPIKITGSRDHPLFGLAFGQKDKSDKSKEENERSENSDSSHKQKNHEN